MKVDAIIKEFLYVKKIENHTERTLRGYRHTLDLFSRWLKAECDVEEIDEVKVFHLKAYISYHLSVGHKPSYINGILKTMRSFFKYTNGEEYSAVNYKKVSWVKQEKPVIKVFTDDSIRKMLHYFNNKTFLGCRNLTVITMFIETGIRCKELIDIMPEDIKENYILIHGKNHKERMVPITMFLGKQLIKYNIWRDKYFYLKDIDANFFLSNHGRALTNSAVEHIVKAAGKGIDDARVSPHTFRHYYAHKQLEGGMDVYTLSRLLGHENISITQIYLQSLRDSQIVMNSIDKSVISML